MDYEEEVVSKSKNPIDMLLEFSISLRTDTIRSKKEYEFYKSLGKNSGKLNSRLKSSIIAEFDFYSSAIKRDDKTVYLSIVSALQSNNIVACIDAWRELCDWTDKKDITKVDSLIRTDTSIAANEDRIKGLG